MLKYLLAVLLIFGLNGVSYGKQDFQHNEITYVWEEEPDYEESRTVFLNAFVKCYDQVPLAVLRQPSRDAMIQWLDHSFKDSYAENQHSESSLWLTAKVHDKVVGFVIIDVAKYPEEVYFAQLAIDPAYQRKGIASSMILGVMEQFPKCAKFVVITRHANEEAKCLYSSLGFAPSPYMHAGYNPELYTGFEYYNLQSQDG